jgi:putative membrane protein
MKRNFIIAALVVLAGCYAGNASAQTASGQTSSTSSPTGATAQSGTTQSGTGTQSGTTGTATQNRRNRSADTSTSSQTGTASQSGSQTNTSRRNSSDTNATSQASTSKASEKNSENAAGARKASSDQAFAKRAAEGGMAEVKLGQLAQEKGSSQAVKDFGKRMVDDHNKANDQLKQAASKQSIDLPSDVKPRDKAQYDKLSKLSGTDFDRAYARMMVRDHNKDVAEFQREANNGKDSDLKSFASSTLPTLQDHLKMARDMEKEVGQSTRSNTNNNKNQNNQNGNLTRPSGS